MQLRLPKELINLLKAIGKYLLQLGLHKPRMHQPTQNAKRQDISDDICHFYTAVYRLEMVFVVPYFIWADALFVYKEVQVFDGFDFGHPA